MMYILVIMCAVPYLWMRGRRHDSVLSTIIIIVIIIIIIMHG